jgi:hypothetical protein
MTEKLLKQLMNEKQQELEQITKNDPQIINLTNQIIDLKQLQLKFHDDNLALWVYQKIINMKQDELSKITKYNRKITKLKMDIWALETTLQTITKNKKQPENTAQEKSIPPKTFAIIKAIPLLPKPVQVHPLDRPSVDKKIDFFHKQTKNFTIKKDYKNNQLSLWDQNNKIVSFSLNNTKIDEEINEHIDTWLDKTLRCSHYYNKLTKIFNKTNKEYFIVTTFDKQGDRIYVKYCHNSKTPNTRSVLHIKKKGKSFIETTKEIDCKKDYFEIPLKNNTSVQVSGYNNTDYDDFNLTVELKHIERHVKQNDLEKHFENIFNALKKQNHLG